MLQEVSGYSPLAAGMALLPLTAIMLALSARSAALAARIGPRLQMTVGPLLIAAGMVLFTRVQGDGDYVTQVLPAVLVLGLGLATNVAPLTATALSAAPAEHAGIASAVNNDVARSAALIAVAVLPALAGLTGDAYLHPAVLTQGFHTAMLISAVAAAMGGILALATIRNPLRGPREQAEPAGPLPAQAAPAGSAPADGIPSAAEVSYPHCCALDGPPLRTILQEPQQPQ